LFSHDDFEFSFIYLKFETGNLGTGYVTAIGGSNPACTLADTGAGGAGSSTGEAGAANNKARTATSSGRIHLSYLSWYTGSTIPTLDVLQDNTMSTAGTYNVELIISQYGTGGSENFSKNTTLLPGTCTHLALSWTVSTSTLEVVKDGVSLGTYTGIATSIHDNASSFAVGAHKNSAGEWTDFFDGRLDDVRIWNTARTAAQILANYQRELGGNETNLQAYWKLNNSYLDSTSNNNTLTPSGTPAFQTGACFLDATTTSTSTTTTSTSTTTTSTSTTTTSTSSSTTTTSTSMTTTSTSTTTTSTSLTTTSTTTTSTSTTFDYRFIVELGR
jgi:hypothetical protein